MAKRKRARQPKVGDIVQDSGGRKFAVVKAEKGASLASCMDLSDKEMLMKSVDHLTVVGEVPDIPKVLKQASASRQQTIRRHEVHRDAIHRSHFGKTNGPY